MNYYNRRLSGILDIFRTFIGHNCWHLLGDSGDYLAVGKSSDMGANGQQRCQSGNKGSSKNVQIEQ